MNDNEMIMFLWISVGGELAHFITHFFWFSKRLKCLFVELIMRLFYSNLIHNSNSLIHSQKDGYSIFFKISMGLRPCVDPLMSSWKTNLKT